MPSDAKLSVSPITDVFREARSDERVAFMPFVTAGDPDLQTTIQVINDLTELGADLIEVGIPYSDPVADDPVIQASYTRALEAGFKIDNFFAAFQNADHENWPPLIAMVSFSILYRYGIEKFLDQAVKANFAGLIVPDFPGDEARDLASSLRQRNLDLIPLLSPLTPAERVPRILANGSGFVYCISTAGTTGARDALPTAITEQLGKLRQLTQLPLAVGFGVSRPEQIQSLHGHADGAIVGSAIVREFEHMRSRPQESLTNLRDYVRTLIDACQP